MSKQTHTGWKPETTLILWLAILVVAPILKLGLLKLNIEQDENPYRSPNTISRVEKALPNSLLRHGLASFCLVIASFFLLFSLVTIFHVLISPLGPPASLQAIPILLNPIFFFGAFILMSKGLFEKRDSNIKIGFGLFVVAVLILVAMKIFM